MNSMEARRQDLMRKRGKAIQALRDTGLTDEEIERDFGISIEIAGPMFSVDSEGGIDAEVVSVDEGEHEPTDDETQPMANGDTRLDTRVLVVLPGLPATENDSETNKPGRYTEGWWEQASLEQQCRRCRAHSTRHGGQCGMPAIKGAAVCRAHGGAAPQVKQAARVRLEMAADRMAANLLRLGTDAASESVQLGATNSALDRVGLSKPTEVVVSPGEPKPYEVIFERIVGDSRAESRARRGLDAGEDGGLNRSASGLDVSLDDYGDNDGKDRPEDETSWNAGGSDGKVYTPSGGLSGRVPRDFDRRDDGPSPRRFGREHAAEDAVAAANRANARVQGQRAIESPHKRYLRP